MKKILVVLSGGQDSTTCLFMTKKAYPDAEIHALTFDYGQKHVLEVQAAQRIALLANCKSHEVLHVGDILHGTSPLVNKAESVEAYKDFNSLPGGIEKTFVPMRNTLFLTLAYNRAVVLGCDTVVTGVCEEDFGGYPDCRMEFIIALDTAFNYSLKDVAQINIQAPLMYQKKRATVEAAAMLPGCMEALAYSHTFYNGVYPPCGTCHACLLREKGFHEAGLLDPLTQRAALEAVAK